MSDKKKFQNMEDLTDRVIDLSESERKKQETANAIYETLLDFVNQKNEKANAYEKTFRRRLEGKINKREVRQGNKEMKAKYGTTEKDFKAAERHKAGYTKEDYKKVLQKLKGEHKNRDEIKADIFETIKRAFNKNITLHQGSDIDKDASLFLLKLTGFFKDKDEQLELNKIIKEVPQGESGEKGLSIDTGGTISGIKVNNVVKKTDEKQKAHKSLIGSQVIVSEHSDLSPQATQSERPTSSAHMIYFMLDQLGQIKPEHREQLQRFINFVDIVDSLDYQASGMDYRNSYRTLFGLYRNLRVEDIYKYFKNPKNTGFELLDDNFLKSYKTVKHFRKDGKRITEEKTLKQISEDHHERVENNIKGLEELEDQGYTIATKRKEGDKIINSQFIVILGENNKVKDIAQAASYHGKGVFKIGTNRDGKPYLYIFDPEFKFPKKFGGVDTDDHFIHYKNLTEEVLVNILNEFNKLRDDSTKQDIGQEIREFMNKIWHKHEKKQQNTPEMKEKAIQQLAEIDPKTLEIGKTLTGVVNNVNGKNIYVNITPTIIGMIKCEQKEKELVGGEIIPVKIKNISQGENKLLISLEKVVA